MLKNTLYVIFGVVGTLLGIIGLLVCAFNPSVGVFPLLIAVMAFYAQWYCTDEPLWVGARIANYIQSKINNGSENVKNTVIKLEEQKAVASKLMDERKELKDAQKKIKQIGELRRADFIQRISARCQHPPIQTKVLGGSGWEVVKDEVLIFTCMESALSLANVNSEKEVFISFSELVSMEISGPGTETSNFGLAGGGFGIEGAAKGILISSVINAITTTSKTNTFLRISTRNAEVLLHITAIEPAALRLVLSPAFVRMEASRQERPLQHSGNGVALSEEIEKLHSMFVSGVLSEDEFNAAKKRLLAVVA